MSRRQLAAPEAHNDREGRPAENEAACKCSTMARENTSTVPSSDNLLADLDALSENLSGYLVVQVRVDDVDHWRTRVYRSAAAAQKAVERAHERGRTAHVSLCRLLPVGVVVGLGGGRR